MSNLFELNETYKKLSDMVDIDEKTLQDTLSAISDERETKLDNLASWIKDLRGKSEGLAESIENFKAEKKSVDNKIKWINSYMTAVMDDAGIKKMITKRHILKPQNNRASVVVKSLDSLPSEYIKEKTTISADKTALYKALKAGVEVPGATLKPSRSTRIM